MAIRRKEKNAKLNSCRHNPYFAE